MKKAHTKSVATKFKTVCVLVSHDQKKIFKTKKYIKAKESYDLINTSGMYNAPQLKNVSSSYNNFKKRIKIYPLFVQPTYNFRSLGERVFKPFS